MTKDIPVVKTTASVTEKRKPFNRNFINSLPTRMARILNAKQQRWCYNFETETAIDLRDGGPLPRLLVVNRYQQLRDA